MLDEQELSQVRDYVIRILPELLRKEPEIATTIEGILAQQFPRRDEFARLLEEVKLLREDMQQRFNQVDQRFNQMDQHLDQVGHSLLEARRNIAQLQHGQEMILEQLSGQAAWLRFVTGSLRSEKGQALEDLFAVALRYGLKNPDIAPERIRLRQRLVDTDGRVFRRGFATEVDLIAEDGKLTVFEVKATPKASDVSLFALEAELVAAQNPDKQVQGVLISPAVTEEVRQRCAEHGLELVELQAEDFS